MTSNGTSLEMKLSMISITFSVNPMELKSGKKLPDISFSEFSLSGP